MANPDFDDLFEAAAIEFEAAFVRSSHATRPDEIGAPREDQLRAFLRDWLPERIGVTNGYVISRGRQISRQCDVVFIDATRSPKFVIDKATDRRLIPYGDVYGVIEAKSTLGRSELEDALAKFKVVDTLFRSDRNQYHVPGDDYRELSVQLKEAGPSETDYGYEPPSASRQRYMYSDDRGWSNYLARVGRQTDRTKPFKIVFAYKLSPSITADEVESILNSSDSKPSAVVVLDTGVFLSVNERNLSRRESLKSGTRLDGQYLGSIFELSDLAMQSRRFVREELSNRRSVLLLFYALLLDMLEDQVLPGFSYADLLAVWRRSEE